MSLTVNTTEDENNGYLIGAKSLREAIEYAVTTGEVDSIEFDASLAGHTIELGSLGQITINCSVNIVGLGADALTINAKGSASNSKRIFTVNAGQSVTISDVTLTGGYVTGTNVHGGAILNSGDALNRLKTETNDFGTRTSVYDNAGNLASITDRRNYG